MAVLGLSTWSCEEGRRINRPGGTDAGNGGSLAGIDAGVAGAGAGGRTGGGGADAGGADAGAAGASGAPGAGGGTGGRGSGGTPGSGGTGAGGQGAGGRSGSGGATGAGGSTGPMLSGSTTQAFGNLPIGFTSAPFVWTIRNTGGQPTAAPQSVIDNPTELNLMSNGCTAPIPAGGSCSITVTFTPSDPGQRRATMTVNGGVPAGSVTLTATAGGGSMLVINKTGDGTVTSDVGGINCGTSCSVLVVATSIVLTAQTANGGNSIFLGWGGTCSGRTRQCTLAPHGATTVTAFFAPIPANLIFASSVGYPSNRGSAASYDAACNALASAAGINDGSGTGYTAMISDVNSLGRKRLGATARGWVRTDLTPFADTQDSLFDSQAVFNDVRFDENGAEVNASIMTGTSSNGTLTSLTSGAGPATNCQNWTNAADPTGFAGTDAHSGAGAWLSHGVYGCAGNFRLLCMGHTRDAAVVPLVRSGRKIWVSNAGLTVGGAQTPDALCQASRPPGVTAAAALIAYVDRAAASVLDPNSGYVRPDGTWVATGSQLAAASGVPYADIALDSGISQLGNGGYVQDQGGGLQLVWTGQTTLGVPGTLASTCGNWTDRTQTSGAVGSPNWTLNNWWSFFTAPSCGLVYPVYCVQTPPL